MAAPAKKSGPNPIAVLSGVKDGIELYEFYSDLFTGAPDPNDVINEKLDLLLTRTTEILEAVEENQRKLIQERIDEIAVSLDEAEKAFHAFRVNPIASINPANGLSTDQENALNHSSQAISQIKAFVDGDEMTAEQKVLVLPYLMGVIPLRYEVLKQATLGDIPQSYAQEWNDIKDALNELRPLVDGFAREAVEYYVESREYVYFNTGLGQIITDVDYVISVRTGTSPVEEGPARIGLRLPADTDDYPDYVLGSQEDVGGLGYEIGEQIFIDKSLFLDFVEDAAGFDAARQFNLDVFAPVEQMEIDRAGGPEMGGLAVTTIPGWLEGGLFQDFANEDYLRAPLGSGNGNNKFEGFGGDDFIEGGTGNDVILGDNAFATAAIIIDGVTIVEETGGGVGNDLLFGYGGDDNIFGYGGDDTLHGGEGNDRLEGGAGNDTVKYATSEAGVTVNLTILRAQDTIGNGIDQIRDVENLEGSFYDDVLTGNGSANRIVGRSGDDIISGGSGDDELIGDDEFTVIGGNDTLEGGRGEDLLDGSAGNDTLRGGDDDDTLIGGTGDDLLDGGAGIDTAVYEGNDNVSVSLATEILLGSSGGAMGNDTLFDIENITTGGGNDFIEGNSGNNHLIAGAGNDFLFAGLGDDIIDGGEGNDRAYFDSGQDITIDLNIVGAQDTGEGLDTLINIETILVGAGTHNLIGANDGFNSFYGGSGDTTVTFGAGNYSFYGQGGFNKVIFTTPESLVVDLNIGSELQNAGSAVFRLENVQAVTTGDGFDNIKGNEADNVLDGGGNVDRLEGKGGNDTLLGGHGVDILLGGDGADILNGGTGIDFIQYTDATSGVVVDLLNPGENTGFAAGDTFISVENIWGSDFDDDLRGHATTYEMKGGDGDDRLTSRGGTRTFDGGDGFDMAIFDIADDVNIDLSVNVTGYLIGGLFVSLNDIEGIGTGSGTNTVKGSDGDDRFEGGSGDDTFTGGLGNNYISGGAGFDTVVYEGSANLRVNLLNTAAQATGVGTDTLIGIEGIKGGDGFDILTGNNEDNVIDGGNGVLNFLSGLGGDDMLIGGSGEDILSGGLGADHHEGGGGSNDRADYFNADMGVTVDLVRVEENTGEAAGDTYNSIENITGSDHDDILRGNGQANTILGEGGNDILMGRGGNDELDGGDGIDTVSYEEAGNRVVVLLSQNPEAVGNGTEGTDQLTSIENVIGSAFGDRLVGDANDNHLQGGAGADVLVGLAGNDTLEGDAGDDDLTGSGGNDILRGGADNDTLNGLGGADLMEGGDGDDQIFAGLGVDTVQGGDGNDRVFGNFGADLINGNDGNDDIRAGGSSDTLFGDAGNDKIVGGNGKDILFGGAGNDVLTGGNGNALGDGLRDVFVFKTAANGGGGFDRIRDFEDTKDKIDLLESSYVLFSEVLEDATQVGAHVQINLDNSGIVQIENFTLDQLTEGDFILPLV